LNLTGPSERHTEQEKEVGKNTELSGKFSSSHASPIRFAFFVSPDFKTLRENQYFSSNDIGETEA
jgi:hypothetical protein